MYKMCGAWKMTTNYEKIKAILEARDCIAERIKCRKCKIQEVCQSLQIKQWLESEEE